MGDLEKEQKQFTGQTAMLVSSECHIVRTDVIDLSLPLQTEPYTFNTVKTNSNHGYMQLVNVSARSIVQNTFGNPLCAIY